MKKLLFILMAVIMTSVVHATNVVTNDSTVTKVTESVTSSNVEKLVDKYSAKIEASVISLAQSLKQPAEHVYKVLVRQQVVHSFGLLVFPVFLIISIISFYKLMKFGLAETNNNSYVRTNFDKHEDWLIPILIVVGIAIAFFLIATFVSFTDMLQGFINPEYGALKDIVNMIK